jgi:flagellar hook-associated protein 1 FlgK
MRQDIDTEIATIPENINEITAEIADLNSSIRLAEIEGGSANDLRDKRDQLLDDLSEYSSLRAVEQKDGTYTVIIGSHVVVDHEKSTELQAITSITENGNERKTVIRSEDGTEYVPDSGKLGALIRIRDTVIGEILNKLDNLAGSLVQSVNFEHRNGYGLDGQTGRNFFNPNYTKAFNISLSSDIDDVSNIAASGTGDRGDNTNALAINGVRDQKVVEGEYTVSEYYSALIADIGILGREAKSGRQNEELLVSQIDNSRESIKGVSIDEELIRMIQTQYIYQGASRVVVTIDSLLETLIAMK